MPLKRSLWMKRLRQSGSGSMWRLCSPSISPGRRNVPCRTAREAGSQFVLLTRIELVHAV